MKNVLKILKDWRLMLLLSGMFTFAACNEVDPMPTRGDDDTEVPPPPPDPIGS